MNHIARDRRCILIVDDDRPLADLIAGVLTEENYEVVVCYDSQEAVQRVHDLRPDALILDVLMPNVDGFTVLRELRGTKDGANLPVLLMSGAWRPLEKQRDIGGTPGMAPTVVLPKPFELRDLNRCLQQLGV